MNSTTLVHENAAAGIKQFWHEDAEGNVTLQTQQDVSQVIEQNKREFNSVDERAGWGGEMHKVASIPLSLLHELEKKGITKDPARLKAWLNDPDNRAFRTRPGKV